MIYWKKAVTNANGTVEYRGVSASVADPLPVSATVNLGDISVDTAADASAADPLYVEGTSNPLSQNLHGYLRVIAGNFPALVDVNSGNKSNNTQRVVIASDNPALAVSGTFWQATQPVSGTFWQATQPVSGTFWQATQPVSLSTLPALVAGTALIGYVGHGKTIKTATVNITSDTDIIAAVTSKRIKVIAYALFKTGTGANPILFKSNGTGGTELARVLLQSQASAVFGANLSIAAPSFLFATVAGEKLTMDVGDSDTITGFITYFDDDAT